MNQGAWDIFPLKQFFLGNPGQRVDTRPAGWKLFPSFTMFFFKAYLILLPLNEGDLSQSTSF